MDMSLNLKKSFVVHYQNIRAILKDKKSNLVLGFELKEGSKWAEIKHSEGVTLSQNRDENGVWKIEVENWIVTDKNSIEAVNDMSNNCKLVFIHYIKENKYGFIQGIEFKGDDIWHSSYFQDTRINVLPVTSGVSVKVQGMQKQSCSPLYMDLETFEKSIA